MATNFADAICERDLYDLTDADLEPDDDEFDEDFVVSIEDLDDDVDEDDIDEDEHLSVDDVTRRLELAAAMAPTILPDGRILMTEAKCRVCGCTNERTCPGGCVWAEPNLCSRCALDPFDGAW